MIGLWCATTGRKVYHPLPTIVDHDVNLVSTYGNDNHENRRSTVRWDIKKPREGALQTRIPHMGCFYESTPHNARAHVRNAAEDEDFADARFRELLADNGRSELRKLHYAKKARSNRVGHNSIFIATPTRGSVHPEYSASVWRILRDEELDADSCFEVEDVQVWSADLVRVRSRYVTYFLQSTGADRLLFLDSDVTVPTIAIRGMLSAMASGEKHFVACPYPRRDGVDWARVKKNLELPAEAVAYRYSINCLNDQIAVFRDGTAEVKEVPLGCAMISREGLEMMTDAYRSSLSFRDDKGADSVALFQLILDGMNLYSEDYSFCRRWREIGLKVWAYFGTGSPVDHWGEHRYRGALEAFRMRRT